MLEQILRQGPGGDLLHHQIIVLLIDTARQSHRAELDPTEPSVRRDGVWSMAQHLLVEPDVGFLQLVRFGVGDGVAELPAPLAQHHPHDLHQVRGVPLVVNDANLGTAAPLAVPDAPSQSKTLHKDPQG